MVQCLAWFQGGYLVDHPDQGEGVGSPLGSAVVDLHPAHSSHTIFPTRTPISVLAGDLVVVMKELGVVEDLHMAAVADMVGGAVDLDVPHELSKSCRLRHVHDMGTVCCYALGSCALYRT